MPDQFGFDHLGIEVRCIEDGCGLRGSMSTLNEAARRRHHQKHETERRRELERRRRELAKKNLGTARREKKLEREVLG